MSTFISIFFLDVCLFNSNQTCGQICDTLTNAKAFLEDKIKHAYDSMDDWIKPSIPKITKYSKSSDDAGIWFSNGSSIRVGTSFRSGTLQFLHVSEHAKICSSRPDKAREIKNGALNTVQAGQFVFIESTAEDKDGDFYTMTKRAEENQLAGAELSELDYRFQFFTWHRQPEYRLSPPDDFKFSIKSREYFDSLPFKMDDEQKYWYVKKKETLGDDMFQEYPSIPEEAFEQTNEGRYFHTKIQKLINDGRYSEFGIEEGILIDTFWDLGMNDYMSIWFVQFINKEIRIVDFLEGSGEGLAYYAERLKEKGRPITDGGLGYKYGRHTAPHDIKVRELTGSGESRQEYAKKLGINFEIAPNLSFEDGIDAARRIINNCWFRKSTTEDGFKHLQKYSKKWSEALGCYTGEKHDQHSHASAAFRYLAVSSGLNHKDDDDVRALKAKARMSFKPQGD